MVTTCGVFFFFGHDHRGILEGNGARVGSVWQPGFTQLEALSHTHHCETSLCTKHKNETKPHITGIDFCFFFPPQIKKLQFSRTNVTFTFWPQRFLLCHVFAAHHYAALRSICLFAFLFCPHFSAPSNPPFPPINPEVCSRFLPVKSQLAPGGSRSSSGTLSSTEKVVNLTVKSCLSDFYLHRCPCHHCRPSPWRCRSQCPSSPAGRRNTSRRYPECTYHCRCTNQDSPLCDIKNKKDKDKRSK